MFDVKDPFPTGVKDPFPTGFCVINRFPVDIDVIYYLKKLYCGLKIIKALTTEEIYEIDRYGQFIKDDIVYKRFSRPNHITHYTMKCVNIQVSKKIIRSINFHYLKTSKSVYVDFEDSKIKYLSILPNQYFIESSKTKPFNLEHINTCYSCSTAGPYNRGDVIFYFVDL